MQFKFKLEQTVVIGVSTETGVIVARAEYTNSENQYLVRYSNGNGCAVEQWWSEDALTAA